MGILEVTSAGLTAAINSSGYADLIKISLVTVLIVIYAVFIYYFYKFLAKKNIIELNLSKYNRYDSGFLLKLFTLIFFVLEYIIILPILTFFWFGVLSVLLFLLSESLSMETVILISGALVASVRITSYFSENLSQDLAKMLPLTLLGVAITKPQFFDLTSKIARIEEIPTIFMPALYYLSFIIIVEIVMRLYDIIKSLTQEEKAMNGESESTKIEVEEE